MEFTKGYNDTLLPNVPNPTLRAFKDRDDLRPTRCTSLSEEWTDHGRRSVLFVTLNPPSLSSSNSVVFRITALPQPSSKNKQLHTCRGIVRKNQLDNHCLIRAPWNEEYDLVQHNGRFVRVSVCIRAHMVVGIEILVRYAPECLVYCT